MSNTTDELLALPDGWDGHDAARIDRRAIEAALLIASTPPTLVPTIPGGVQLEWYIGDLHAVIEIRPDGTIGEVA